MTQPTEPARTGDLLPKESEYLLRRIEMLNQRAAHMAELGIAEESARLAATARQIERMHPELQDAVAHSAGTTRSFSRAADPAHASRNEESQYAVEMLPRGESGGPSRDSDVELLPEPPGHRELARDVVKAEPIRSVLPALDAQPATSSAREPSRKSTIARVSANGGPQEVGTGEPNAELTGSQTEEGSRSIAERPAVVRPRRDFVSILDGVKPVAENAPPSLVQGPEAKSVAAAEVGAVPPPVETRPKVAAVSSLDDWDMLEEAPQHRVSGGLANLNTVSLAGLALGISGLIGLSFWHRLERRHFRVARR